MEFSPKQISGFEGGGLLVGCQHGLFPSFRPHSSRSTVQSKGSNGRSFDWSWRHRSALPLRILIGRNSTCPAHGWTGGPQCCASFCFSSSWARPFPGSRWPWLQRRCACSVSSEFRVPQTRNSDSAMTEVRLSIVLPVFNGAGLARTHRPTCNHSGYKLRKRKGWTKEERRGRGLVGVG